MLLSETEEISREEEISMRMKGTGWNSFRWQGGSRCILIVPRVVAAFDVNTIRKQCIARVIQVYSRQLSTVSLNFTLFFL